MLKFPFMVYFNKNSKTLKKIIDITGKKYPNHLHKCVILNPSSSLYFFWYIIE
jgi:hypothetical protein